jgi:hypothetical protein
VRYIKSMRILCLTFSVVCLLCHLHLPTTYCLLLHTYTCSYIDCRANHDDDDPEGNHELRKALSVPGEVARARPLFECCDPLW